MYFAFADPFASFLRRLSFPKLVCSTAGQYRYYVQSEDYLLKFYLESRNFPVIIGGVLQLERGNGVGGHRKKKTNIAKKYRKKETKVVENP